MLYQLSYFRKNKPHQSSLLSPQGHLHPDRFLSGKRWIRTTEGVRQQIYSLPHLATLVSSQYFCLRLRYLAPKLWSRWRDSNPRPRDYKSRALANWATSASLPFTGCKGRYFFLISKLFATFFYKLYFGDSKKRPALFVQRTFEIPLFPKCGKSSANIATLYELKNIVTLFFCKKLKKMHFRIYLYI